MYIYISVYIYTYIYIYIYTYIYVSIYIHQGNPGVYQVKYNHLQCIKEFQQNIRYGECRTRKCLIHPILVAVPQNSARW